jgi:uncharacterized protein (DUF58 family)
LVAKKTFRRGLAGEHPTPRSGFSLEFSDYRNYHAGADLRYVDWNAYRRLEKLFVKVFTTEEDLNLYLLIDASFSMGEGQPAKLTYAKNVAAALGYMGLRNLDRVGAAGFAGGILDHLPLARGKTHILALFHFLQRLGCSGETDLRAAVRSFSRHFPRPGMVVLLSDLWDPAGVRAAMDELLARKHQVVVIHILDQRELELPAAGAVAVQDVENARERNVFLDADLTRLFRIEVQRYLEEAKSFCLSRGVDYLRATTDLAFEDLVLLYLRQRRSVV